MREIKYQAYDKKDKKIYPVYKFSFFDNGELNRGAIMLAKDTRNYANNLWQSLGEVEIREYTGLHDKNGKEIYEGDILKWKTYNDRLEVKWGRVGWVLSSKLFTNIVGHCQEVNTEGYTVNSEVIGNIWENPDLLSQKEGDK